MRTRDKVTQEALELINGDRQDQYGQASLNFLRIANRWSQQMRTHVEPADVALAMAEVKLARLAEGYKRDSVVDAIGYLALYAELEEASHGKANQESQASADHETTDQPGALLSTTSKGDAPDASLGG